MCSVIHFNYDVELNNFLVAKYVSLKPPLQLKSFKLNCFDFHGNLSSTLHEQNT